MNYWDPFENRNSGEFPEGTPMEMRELSKEPGEDLFGASGFMGQVPSFAKEENGGPLKIAAAQESQVEYHTVAEDIEPAVIDVSPKLPATASLIQRAPVGGDKEVIVPLPSDDYEPMPVPDIAQLSHVVVNAIADEGVSLNMGEGAGVFNFLNEKLGGDIINIINWTISYCNQIANEITGLYAPSIAGQSLWNIAYTIHDFKESVVAALDYNRQQVAKQQADTAGAEAEVGAGAGAGITFDPSDFYDEYGPTFDPGDVVFDPGDLVINGGTWVPPTPSPPAVVEEPKTPWGLIALAGIAALLILK